MTRGPAKDFVNSTNGLRVVSITSSSNASTLLGILSDSAAGGGGSGGGGAAAVLMAVFSEGADSDEASAISSSRDVAASSLTFLTC